MVTPMSHTYRILLGLAFSATWIVGCQNNQYKANLSNLNALVSASPSPTSVSTYKISNVLIQLKPNSSAYKTQIYFDLNQSPDQISTQCTPSAGAKPCACVYSWDEIN